MTFSANVGTISGMGGGDFKSLISRSTLAAPIAATRTDILRHSSFAALRDDKEAREIKWE